MDPKTPADIEALDRQLDDAERDARALVEGLSEAQGGWRPAPGSWSIAECLDHLATANRVYLEAMRGAAERARAHGRQRRGPAAPGIIGRWFVRSFEPPPRIKSRAPRKIQPRQAPSLADASARFFEAQNEVREFLRRYADIDLARVRFPNPLVPGIRFSLATGLHVIPAHERRHLWQARRVLEAAGPASSASATTRPAP